MAYNYLNLYKDRSFKSKTVEDKETFAIQGKTCMYILLSTDDIDKLQSCGESEVDDKIEKMNEIVHILRTDPENENSKNRFGAIYFKTEDDEVFPRLYLYKEFCDFIRDNFPNAVLKLEGKLRLEGGSSAYLPSKCKRIQESCDFKDHVESLALTTPFPLELVQPIKDCKWILESFSLSIGWKEEGWCGGSLESCSNHLLQNLFGNDSPPKDFKLVAGNGAEIPFHGLILAAKSPALAAMVNPNGAMKEHESKRIDMKAFSEESLKAFVSFIYCQTVPLKEMDCDTVLELFRLGHMYQLPEMTRALSKMMLQKGEEWFSPNCALEMYFFVKNLGEFKDLAHHTVATMIKFGDAVRESERYQELDMKEANDLLWILLKNK